jgi:hypothetical protein
VIAKVTRRGLFQTALTAAVVEAQTAPPAPAQLAAAELAKATREQNQRMGETLAKFELPLATEPAFQFKA